MRGAVFESWVVSGVPKTHYHHGVAPSAPFFRDRRGHEVDLVLEQGTRIITAEIKSAATVAGDFLDPLVSFRAMLAGSSAADVEGALVDGGEQGYRRRGVQIVPWNRLDAWTRGLL